MAQHWYSDIKEMLKDSGSIELPHGGGHYKYRLPNGNLFTFPKTPSSPSGVQNCLARLRSELRFTHPEISQRGRNLSKEKMERITYVAKPGDEEQIIRNHAIHPGATWIIGRVVNSTEDSDFESSEKVSLPPSHRLPIRIEDSEMSSMLDRARTALEEVKKRLASYNQDADIEKQLKLEEYIGKQEAIAREAAELLDFGVIPPEAPVVVAAPVEKKQVGKRKSGIRMPLDLVETKIFPRFASHFNGNGFTAADFVGALRMEGVEGIDRKSVANWLGNHVSVLFPSGELLRAGTGHYTLKPVQEVVDSEEAMPSDS